MSLSADFPGDSFKTMSIFLDGLFAFGEELRIDARRTQFILSTRNLSLTSQAIIRLSPHFFDKYILENDQSLKGRLLSKKLRMVFRKNLANAASLNKCSIDIDDRSYQEGTEYSRINLGLEYQNGVKKKHSLWFSESDNIDQLYPQRAPFEFSANPNLFSSFTAFFNNHEVSDIVLECTSTSVTMRSYSGTNVTAKDRNPLETKIQISSADFQRYNVTEDVTLVFNLKEFKSVLSFLEAIQAPLFARFEEPGKPIVFFYQESNVIAEFALVTIEYEVDMAQNEFTSINISTATSGASHTMTRGHATRNNRYHSPDIRSETSHDTQPEPDVENLRRLAQRQAYDSDSSVSSSKRQNQTSSRNESLKKLKMERAKRRVPSSTESEDESSPSLVMIEPEFDQNNSNQRLSLGSRNAEFPFGSSLESIRGKGDDED